MRLIDDHQVELSQRSGHSVCRLDASQHTFVTRFLSVQSCGINTEVNVPGDHPQLFLRLKQKLLHVCKQ